MKTVNINKNDYKTYKDFYEDMSIKLGANKIKDYYNTITFEYNPNLLWEFLEMDGYGDKAIYKFVLKNFDLEKIKQQKTYDDYEWNIIIKVLQDFINKFPNNKLEFIND